jgi:hypothetical protein
MLLPEGSSAICVQRFDGSRNSAIHTTYRISLRSSSLREPRYPLLRVVFVGDCHWMAIFASGLVWLRQQRLAQLSGFTGCGEKTRNRADNPRKAPVKRQSQSPPAQGTALHESVGQTGSHCGFDNSMILPQVHLGVFGGSGSFACYMPRALCRLLGIVLW